MRVNLEKLQAKRDAAQAQRERIRTNERNARRAALLSNIPRTGAVMTRSSGAVNAVPKQPRERNPYLLDMAKGRPCLFWFVADCRRDYDTGDRCTTVKAHDNRLSSNKGKGYKAHDWCSVDGCKPCHDAYDIGTTHTREEKDAAFDAALERQMQSYRDLLSNPLSRPKDRDAARWALNRYEFQRLKGDQS